MSKHDFIPAAQEWSHDYISDNVDGDPVSIEISAPADSFPLLCKRLNLHSIESLVANIILTRNPVSKAIHIDGRIEADVHQKCVVTAEPVAEHIENSFKSWFAEPSEAVSFTKVKRDRAALQERAEQPILEEHDDPEEIMDGKIDLGELIVQHLSLFLKPYPKLEGAEFDSKENGLKDDDEMYSNPFAALKDWKADEKKKDK